jgi:hypothetical protein
MLQMFSRIVVHAFSWRKSNEQHDIAVEAKWNLHTNPQYATKPVYWWQDVPMMVLRMVFAELFYVSLGW